MQQRCPVSTFCLQKKHKNKKMTHGWDVRISPLFAFFWNAFCPSKGGKEGEESSFEGTIPIKSRFWGKKRGFSFLFRLLFLMIPYLSFSTIPEPKHSEQPCPFTDWAPRPLEGGRYLVATQWRARRTVIWSVFRDNIVESNWSMVHLFWLLVFWIKIKNTIYQ